MAKAKRASHDAIAQAVVGADVKSAPMRIDPATALQWLEGNTHNRPVRQRDVQRWSIQMKADKWRLNGQAIIFSEDGRLLDGQHRLWACIESQTPFTSMVTFGVDENTFTTIDQGRGRSGADHLYVAGVRSGNLTSVQAVSTLIWKYRNDCIFSAEKVDGETLVAMAKEEPDIIVWTDEARRSPNTIRGFATPVAAALYLGSKTKHTLAKTFLYQWQTGENLASGNPVLTLRNRVMGVTPRKAWERFFLAVSAWNYFSQNKELLRMGALKGDHFPKINGAE